MRFPPEFIERLRNYLPISEVVGRRVPIKRHGREFHGLCPFHKEKSPSFTVSDEKGFYHCFGCGAHGDAIGFIRETEGLSYPEAVERLANEAGLPVPQMTREAEAQEKKRHTLEDVVALAEKWFTEQFHGPQGVEAKSYLDGRGVSAEVAQRFGIGFAPNAREALKTALMKQNIPDSLLVEAGLLAKTEEGASYDRFRGRLMFPIRDARGKTVAFGGRIMPKFQTDKTAKYLNSPETPLFHKGDMLFAYDIARTTSREAETAILAEGYMDVIALHQAGFTSAVAPLGTAVTENQLKLLWRLNPEPTLCLDGDAAGTRAMLRAAELALPMLKPGLSLKFAFLPSGQDPDSFLRVSGKTGMQDALARARILSQMLWGHALTRFGSATAEQRASLEQYLMQSAGRIEDNTVKHSYQQFFRNELFQLNRMKNNKKGALAAAAKLDVTLPFLPEANDDLAHICRLEDRLMHMVLLHPDLLHHSEVEDQLGHMDFTQPSLDKLRQIALEVSASAHSTDSVSLCAVLSARGHEEKVNTLLNSKTALPLNMITNIRGNPQAAHHAFEQIVGAYTSKKLEHEIHKAQQKYELDTSQYNFDHLLSLSKQKADLDRTRQPVWPDEQQPS